MHRVLHFCTTADTKPRWSPGPYCFVLCSSTWLWLYVSAYLATYHPPALIPIFIWGRRSMFLLAYSSIWRHLTSNILTYHIYFHTIHLSFLWSSSSTLSVISSTMFHYIIFTWPIIIRILRSRCPFTTNHFLPMCHSNAIYLRTY